MKVAFIARSTLFSSWGGDTTQIQKTAEHLRLLGIHIDIHLSSDKIDYDQYDLFHFFNIIRPADILRHTKYINKPFVVSTIFLDYGEFEQQARGGFIGLLNKVLPQDTIEYCKVIARRLLNGERIQSWQYLWRGHARSILKIVKDAAILLPNSHSEYQRFLKRYKIKEAPYAVVPNGVDPSLFKENITTKKNKNAVLCVARIEGRKNQLNLIKALNNTKYTLYIIGNPSPNNQKYYDQCKLAAADNIVFKGYVSLDELLEIYQSAEIHVLPSWFETTGLSSIEAALAGCNIVITAKGDTQEYFEDHAFYCEPDDIESIKKAIDHASEAPPPTLLIKKINEQYTWAAAADATLKAYKQVL
ncbi:MAG: glycosyltransferase family 4 protein [Aureispira sp.]|nr:glycosyltransferase family 4 protein [Aureispira sp.]